jgi:Flp pilus assembly protein TadG
MTSRRTIAGRRSTPCCGHQGQSIIEFAFLLPILLLVVFGIVEFGRALMTTNALYAASREGARVVAIGGTDQEARDRVNAVLTAARIDTALSVTTITPPDSVNAISVTVTTTFQILTASVIFDVPTIQLQGSTVMRFEG